MRERGTRKREGTLTKWNECVCLCRKV